MVLVTLLSKPVSSVLQVEPRVDFFCILTEEKKRVLFAKVC